MKTNLKYLDSTTVWNYHSIDLSKLGFNKNSNLNKCLSSLYNSGKRGAVTVEVTCIGWSQHSASQIKIFEGEYNSIYSRRYAIYKLEDFKKEEVYEESRNVPANIISYEH